MKKSALSLLLLLQISYAHASSAPQVGIYAGNDKGRLCTVEIAEVVTDKAQIKKLNRRDLIAGVLQESDLPDYMILARVNGQSKNRVVSGDEHMNGVQPEDRAKGVAHRLSGGGGFLPLPLAWILEIRIDKDRQPLSYSFISTPFGQEIECDDLVLQQ